MDGSWFWKFSNSHNRKWNILCDYCVVIKIYSFPCFKRYLVVTHFHYQENIRWLADFFSALGKASGPAPWVQSVCVCVWLIDFYESIKGPGMNWEPVRGSQYRCDEVWSNFLVKDQDSGSSILDQLKTTGTTDSQTIIQNITVIEARCNIRMNRFCISHT